MTPGARGTEMADIQGHKAALKAAGRNDVLNRLRRTAYVRDRSHFFYDDKGKSMIW